VRNGLELLDDAKYRRKVQPLHQRHRQQTDSMQDGSMLVLS